MAETYLPIQLSVRQILAMKTVLELTLSKSHPKAQARVYQSALDKLQDSVSFLLKEEKPCDPQKS